MSLLAQLYLFEIWMHLLRLNVHWPRVLGRLALVVILGPHALCAHNDNKMHHAKIDIAGGVVLGEIPFDQHIYFTGDIPQDVVDIKVRYAKVDGYNAAATSWASGPGLSWHKPLYKAPAQNPQFNIGIPPLDSRSYYRFKFTVVRKAEVKSPLESKLKAKLSALIWPLGKPYNLSKDKLVRRQLAVYIDAQLGFSHAAGTGNFFNPLTRIQPFHGLVAAQDAIKVKKSIYERETEKLRDLLCSIGGKLAKGSAIWNRLNAGQRKELAEKHAWVVALNSQYTCGKVARGQLRAGDPLTNIPPPLADRINTYVWVDQNAAALDAAIVAYQGQYDQLSDRLSKLAGALAGFGAVGGIAVVRGEVGAAIPRIAKIKAEVDVIQSEFKTRDSEFKKLWAAAQADFKDLWVVKEIVTPAYPTQGDYYSADIGILYAWGLQDALTYIGTNFYFRPYNKDSMLRYPLASLQRVSMTLGITVQDINDDRGTRKGLLTQQQAIVVGLGYRWARYFRVGYGRLLFLQKNKEDFPLGENFNFAWSPYAFAAIDMGLENQTDALTKFFGWVVRTIKPVGP